MYNVFLRFAMARRNYVYSPSTKPLRALEIKGI